MIEYATTPCILWHRGSGLYWIDLPWPTRRIAVLRDGVLREFELRETAAWFSLGVPTYREVAS